MDALTVMVPEADEEVLKQDEEMTLWYIVTTAKRPYKVLMPFLKGKPARGVRLFHSSR